MKPHRFLSSNCSLVIFNLFYPGYTTKINISVNSFSNVSLLCKMFCLFVFHFFAISQKISWQFLKTSFNITLTLDWFLWIHKRIWVRELKIVRKVLHFELFTSELNGFFFYPFTSDQLLQVFYYTMCYVWYPGYRTLHLKK